MATSLLLVICINIDAFSYGIARGLNNQKLKFKTIFFVSTLSSILFIISILLSTVIIKYLDKNICNIINGIVLLLLGLNYIISNTKKQAAPKTSTLTYFLDCLAISADAIFTALLGNFFGNFVIFYMFFYYFSNFFAIFLGNILFLKLGKKFKIISYFGGIIFIILAILKFFGI